MPQVFKVGSYWIYFWTNENKPLEPIHVHIAKGGLSPNATKVWITKAGRCLLCNNNSKFPTMCSETLCALSKPAALKSSKSGIPILEKSTIFVKANQKPALFRSKKRARDAIAAGPSIKGEDKYSHLLYLIIV